MLVFRVGETEVSNKDFLQATFDVVYDRVQKKYINKFMGQVMVDKASDLIGFLNSNLDNLIDVNYDNYSLPQARIVFLNIDTIQKIFRVEMQTELN